MARMERGRVEKTKMNTAVIARHLAEAQSQLAAAVRLHEEAGVLMAQMSPALRIATRLGIEAMIEKRSQNVDRLAALFRKAEAEALAA